MKKISFSALALVFTLSVFAACGPRQGGQVKGDSYVSEGWVNDNTFRVIATGTPKATLTNKIQRRGTAKETAIIMAEKRIIEKLPTLKPGMQRKKPVKVRHVVPITFRFE